MVTPTDRRPIVARVRNLKLQRLPAPLHAGAHLLDDQVGRMLVELVDQRHMHPLPVEAAML